MKQWYVISVSPGYERKVKESLETRVINEQLEERISNVLLPEQEIELASGKKKLKSIWPGYILIEMEMDDDSWYIVRNTTNVTGFVGSSGKGTKPFPVEREKVQQIMDELNKVTAKEKKEEPVNIDFIVGDTVEVIEGNSKGVISQVKEINFDKKEATIEMEFFGRKTPTTIALSSLVKIK